MWLNDGSSPTSVDASRNAFSVSVVGKGTAAGAPLGAPPMAAPTCAAACAPLRRSAFISSR